MKKAVMSLFIFVLLMVNAGALEPQPDSVFVRVIDNGQGLCCVAVMPDDHYIIYDAGRWDNDKSIDGIRELIPAQSVIDLLVISHSDADHLGAVPEICDEYHVARVLRTGMERTSGSWKDANKAIEKEVRYHNCVDINLGECEFPPGATWRFGDVYVTMVCGFHEPPDEWDNDGLEESEERNAVSICIRLQYEDSSILFTGDTVGRHLRSDPGTCIAAERYMVAGHIAGVINIDSDILVGQHHGADNTSTEDFIQAVSPGYVIFSAGSQFNHPHQVVVDRYLDAGVDVENIYRTDWGDNETNSSFLPEWDYEDRSNDDVSGDDGVDVLIHPDGTVEIDWERNDLDPHIRP